MPPDEAGLISGPATLTCLGTGGLSTSIDDPMNVKPHPTALNQEVLAGLVERVTYHNVENGFCVLRTKARAHRDVVTVVGHAAYIFRPG